MSGNTEKKLEVLLKFISVLNKVIYQALKNNS